jgi:hypothetical protein
MAQCDDLGFYDDLGGYHSTNGPDLIGRTYLNGATIHFPDPGFPVTVYTDTDTFSLLELRETEFFATNSAGVVLFSTDFVGSVWDATALDGTPVRLRINQVTSAPDPRCAYETNCIHSYFIDQWIGSDWMPLCGTQSNPIEAIPIAGSWDPSGIHNPIVGTTFACRDGAAGKCLYCHRYLPWISGSDQENLLQSCTRMVRADYCGTGMDNTIGGTPIISGDFLNQHIWNPFPSPPDSFFYEATWGPDGAFCVNRQRHLELLRIADQHPERCRVDQIPFECWEDPPFINPTRILKNKCKPSETDPTICVPLRP